MKSHHCPWAYTIYTLQDKYNKETLPIPGTYPATLVYNLVHFHIHPRVYCPDRENMNADGPGRAEPSTK